MLKKYKNNKFLPYALFCCFLGILDIYAIWISKMFMETRIMGIISLIILCGFMFVISLEDADTKQITRKVNLIFIGCSLGVYIVHFVLSNVHHFSLSVYAYEWIFFGAVTLILAIMEKTKKIGVGDVLFLIALQFCVMTLFGSAAVNVLLIGMMFACIIVVCLQAKTYKVKKDGTKEKSVVAFAPCMFIGIMLAQSLSFYLNV